MIAETAIVYNERVLSNKSISIGHFSVVYENVVIGQDVVIGEHVIIGRTPKPTKAMVRNLKHKKLTTLVGNGVSISAGVIIYEGVEIGDNTLIGDNASIFTNVKIGKEVLISRNVTINGDVTIGDRTRIMDNSHITGRVQIGNNVFISVGVNMVNDNLFGKKGFSNNVRGPIIEDYVSIGVGAILLPNIKIGKGSIVAAGSIVKQDVPDEVIVAGNPAKVISKVPNSMRRE
ncbi:acyltransferase [Parageobacillus thermoglucosidasius]|uniref:acyltransferase n=1 Tax=Parageobacillus thermoglucosidasius TaxID=1426 RepID=UPI0027EFFF32|nr:acyltransferase [Parageobacillus thermoglucosidasius]